MTDSNHKTPFVQGNKFWLNRSSHGRNPKFETPDDLWNAATEYFTWVDEHPLWEDKIVSYQGVTSHEPVAKMRAMTIHGLCLYLDISNQGFFDYGKRPDFIDIVAKITQVIRDQKFIGAAADLLNANIIARDLGLVDKQAVDVNDARTAAVTADEAAAINKQLDAGY